MKKLFSEEGRDDANVTSAVWESLEEKTFVVFAVRRLCSTSSYFISYVITIA